jgi:hypothetical protein
LDLGFGRRRILRALISPVIVGACIDLRLVLERYGVGILRMSARRIVGFVIVRLGSLGVVGLRKTGLI